MRMGMRAVVRSSYGRRGSGELTLSRERERMEDATNSSLWIARDPRAESQLLPLLLSRRSNLRSPLMSGQRK